MRPPVDEPASILVRAGVPEALVPERDMIYDFNSIPRLQKTPYRIVWGGYRPNHIAWLHELKITQPHVTFSFQSNAGVVSRLINGELMECECNPPTVGILAPGTVITTLKTVRHDELFFLYAPESMPFLRDLGIVPGHFELTAGVVKALSEVFAKLSAIYQPGAADYLDHLVLRLLLEIRLSAGNDETQPEASRGIYRGASYIAAHFREEINSEELARQQGMSLRNFYRCWRKCRRDTPHEFLCGLRLEYAKRLLEETNFCIQQVAQESGFPQPMHFTQSFLRKYGQTPSAWRKNHR